MYMHDKGFLVALEGGEGSGKTTTADGLIEYFREYENALIVREPGSSEVGLAIRAAIMEHRSMELETEIALFIASKVEMLQKVVLPALAEGRLVIADRFTGSLFTYQGILRGHGIDPLITKLAAFKATLAPNLNILMTCDPEESVARLQRRKVAGGEINSFDTFEVDKHARLQAAYEESFAQVRARYPHYPSYVVDTTHTTPEQVLSMVTGVIHDHLHRHRELAKAVTALTRNENSSDTVAVQG